MHVLVINDDGPPSAKHSPYVYSLVCALRAAGHAVSVCLPHMQRSWIGKAHFIGDRVTLTYFKPGSGIFGDGGTTHPAPGISSLSGNPSVGQPDDASGTPVAEDEWVLADGTPATCAQLGLFHLFTHRPPIDLVLSGPNYGRNTTAIYSLSSGTLGGAMEAACCGVKAVALSFAYDRPRNDEPAVISGAARHCVRIAEHLCQHWGEGVDLYSVNIPLRPDVEKEKVMVTWMLQNRWGPGESSFRPIRDVGEAAETASEVGQGSEQQSEDDGRGYKHQVYEWGPSHQMIRKGVAESREGSDGLALTKGWTSVTPLKAAFWEVPAHPMGEMKLSTSLSQLQPSDTLPTQPKLLAYVSYEDAYVQPLIVEALSYHLEPSSYSLTNDIPSEPDISKLSTPYLQIATYEELMHEALLLQPTKYIANAYTIRKALIRKHYLAATISTFRAKKPDDPLGNHIPLTLDFELDYVEFLEDALVECYELHDAWERNQGKPLAEREWWILKPSMSDRGQGIRLFSSMDELHAIFMEWEAANPDSSDDEAHEDSPTESDAAAARSDHAPDSGLMASQLRHFIVQRYLEPFLLPADVPHGGRKFHLRTYVLAVGALRVYVHNAPLALFAAAPYVAPGGASTADDDDAAAPLDLRPHLTNTCIQTNSEVTSAHDGPVALFDALDLPLAVRDAVRQTIDSCTASLFRAAAATPAHFQPLPNAFELFGVDWLIDAQQKPWLLEVNAFPDFGQSGNVGAGVVADVWRSAIGIVLGPGGLLGEHGVTRGGAAASGFVQVLDMDLGRR